MKVLKIFSFFIALFVFAGMLPAGAQSDEPPANMVINYAEILPAQGDLQQVDVYFTLVDFDGRAVSDPNVSDATLTIGGTSYGAGAIGRATDPLQLVMVLDISGSMNGQAESRMKAAAIEAVELAPPGTRFTVISFNDQVTRITSPFTTDRDAVIASINALDAISGRGTCLYDATFLALEQYDSTRSGRRGVIVFTDGRDRRDPNSDIPCSTVADATSIVETAQQPSLRIPVYTIGLNSGEELATGVLRNIANQTGGIFVFGDSDDLSSNFQDIMRGLSNQLVARVPVCEEAGLSSGVLDIVTNDGIPFSGAINGLQFTTECDLSTPTPTPTFTFTPTLTPTPTLTSTPTPTATPIPLSIELGQFRTVGNDLAFNMTTVGVGEIAQIEIRVIDAERGVAVPGLAELRYEGDQRDFTIPLQSITAQQVIIEAVAIAPSGERVTEFSSPNINPLRTSTPTPTFTPTFTFTPTLTVTPTLTPTPTFTPTLTNTPLPETNIVSVEFDDDSRIFIMEVRFDRPEQVTGYNLRILDSDRELIFERRGRNGPPENILQVAEDEMRDAPIEGEHEIELELVLEDEIIVMAEPFAIGVSPPPPPPPDPPLLERITNSIQDNPAVAAGVLCLPIAIIMLIIFLTRPKRGPKYENVEWSPSDLDDDLDKATQVGDPLAPLPVGEVIAELRIVTTIGSFEPTPIPFTASMSGYHIGRDGGHRGIATYLNFDKDKQVSRLHATIRYKDGQFELLDEGSVGGTLLNNQKVTTRAQPLLRDRVNEIRLSNDTLMTFTYVDKPASGSMPPPPPASAGISDSFPPPQPDDSSDLNDMIVPPTIMEMPAFQREQLRGDATQVDEFSIEEPMIGPMPPEPNNIELLPPLVDAVIRIEVAPDHNSGEAIPLRYTLLSIGRRPVGNPDAILQFETSSISKQHVQFFWHENSFYIIDMNSTNGTFVDNEELTPRYAMHLLPKIEYAIRLARRQPVRFTFRYQLQNELDDKATNATPETDDFLIDDDHTSIESYDDDEDFRP